MFLNFRPKVLKSQEITLDKICQNSGFCQTHIFPYKDIIYVWFRSYTRKYEYEVNIFVVVYVSVEPVFLYNIITQCFSTNCKCDSFR